MFPRNSMGCIKFRRLAGAMTAAAPVDAGCHVQVVADRPYYAAARRWNGASPGDRAGEHHDREAEHKPGEIADGHPYDAAGSKGGA